MKMTRYSDDKSEWEMKRRYDDDDDDDENDERISEGRQWRVETNDTNSVTRLDNFWKFLATNFLTKVAQLFGDFWGLFEKLWV